MYGYYDPLVLPRIAHAKSSGRFSIEIYNDVAPPKSGDRRVTILCSATLIEEFRPATARLSLHIGMPQ